MPKGALKQRHRSGTLKLLWILFVLRALPSLEPTFSSLQLHCLPLCGPPSFTFGGHRLILALPLQLAAVPVPPPPPPGCLHGLPLPAYQSCHLGHGHPLVDGPPIPLVAWVTPGCLALGFISQMGFLSLGTQGPSRAFDTGPQAPSPSHPASWSDLGISQEVKFSDK